MFQTNSREGSLFLALSRYLLRFGRPDVNLADVMEAGVERPRKVVKAADFPSCLKDPYRPADVLPYLIHMGYCGDERTLESDMHSLYREGVLDRTGTCSYYPPDSPRRERAS